MILLQQGAVRQQLVTIRAPYTAESQQFFFREVQIKHRAFPFHRAVARKNGGDMRLVRRLVRRETRVTINAIYGFCRRRHISRRKAGHLFIHAPDKFQHRRFDQRFILFFARLEPFTAIVALERTQERKSIRGKTRKTGHQQILNQPQLQCAPGDQCNEKVGVNKSFTGLKVLCTKKQISTRMTRIYKLKNGPYRTFKSV